MEQNLFSCSINDNWTIVGTASKVLVYYNLQIVTMMHVSS